MPYYIHHRNGVPISLNSFRISETDIEVSDEVGEQFISTERMLSDFKIENDLIVDTTRDVKPGDRVIRALSYSIIVPTELSIVISPNPHCGAIEFFTKQEVIDVVGQSEFLFLIDGKEYVIDLANFIEGQYSLYTDFTKNSTFEVEWVVDHIFLYRGYGDHFYRHRNKVKSLLRSPNGGLEIKVDGNSAIYVTHVHNPNLIRKVIRAGQPAVIGSGEVGYLNGVRLREV